MSCFIVDDELFGEGEGSIASEFPSDANNVTKSSIQSLGFHFIFHAFVYRVIGRSKNDYELRLVGWLGTKKFD